jgi:transcriptional regulator with XRE-family HTH domain
MKEPKYVPIVEKPVQTIVRKYLEAGSFTQDKFAEALNESLINTNVSRVSVSYWLKGKYEPETDLLLILLCVYSDWRMKFAVEALTAKLPEVFESGIVKLPKAE